MNFQSQWRGLTVADRLLAKTDKSGGDGACWLFTGCRHKAGHGLLVFGDERFAHRVSWIVATGRPIPDGLFVLHRCNNAPCVNPAHLYLGTQKENIRDQINAGTKFFPSSFGRRIPACKHGHAYTPENTYRRPDGWRDCCECRRARSAAHRKGGARVA